MAEPVRILLIQSWIIAGATLRAVLRDAGFEPRIFRVDHVPALAAALSRGRHDVIVLDVASSGLTRETVEALMREHGAALPIVELGESAALAADLRSALGSVRN